MAIDKEDLDLVIDVLDQSSSEVLIEQVDDIGEAWIEAIAENVRNMRKHNLPESQIQTDVIHDVAGLLYKKNDKFWQPRSLDFLVKEKLK